MTLNLTYEVPGRGAWSSVGGALSLDGSKPGPYFRSATGSMRPIGIDVAEKERSSERFDVSINDYAVYRGATEVQKELNRQGTSLFIDGIWGAKTDAGLKTWQESKGIKADGIYGQQTARTLLRPIVERGINNRYTFMAHNKELLIDYACATVVLESGWDLAAVGSTTPRDLGLCQINTAVHNISPSDVFVAQIAVKWKLDIILANFNYALYDPVLAIASYNVGSGGAENWHRNGRQSTWAAANYLSNIKKNATTDELKRILVDY